MRYASKAKVKECIEAIRKFKRECLSLGPGSEHLIYSFPKGTRIDDDDFSNVSKAIVENRIVGIVVYVQSDDATIREYDTARGERAPYLSCGAVSPRVVARLETEEERTLRERLEAKEEAAKTRSAIEQIAQFFKKNQAYRVMVELLLPKRLHPAWKRVLNEFGQKPQQKKEKESKNEK